MSDISTVEYKKICSVENKTVRILAWIFFLPLMLVFAAFKTVRFRILLLTLAIILTSLFVVFVYDFINNLSNAADPELIAAYHDSAELLSSLNLDNAQSDTKLMSDDAIVYITKSGMKYHTENCYLLNENGITKSYGDVWLLGYSPCLKCH